MKKKFIVMTVFAIGALLLTGCNTMQSVAGFEKTAGSELPSGKGIIEVYVTDPPPPDMDEIWVYVDKIEAHIAGTGDSGWVTLVDEPTEFNLKAIVDVQLYLGSQIVDPGKYTQIRLGVTEVRIVVGEEEYFAEVPSGKIKIVGNFEVFEGNTAEITLDFIGEKSVLVTGNGDYKFKPVIKLLVSEPEVLEDLETLGDLEITTESLPSGTVDTAYSAAMEANGGIGDYTWSISEGSLPDGLTIDPATGVISGTPTTEDEYEFKVLVEDESDPVQSDIEDFKIEIELSESM
jgi:hypothetical protein